jgi:hypothetical protein
MNYKILFSVLLTITIVSVIFGTSMSFYINIYDPEWYGLFSNNNSNENLNKRIFLIGSSSVYPINSTYVNHQFSLNKINYEIFNLADMSDSPKKRLQSLSNIISNKPNIVIYGLNIHHFKNYSQNEISFYDQILYPKKIFTNLFDDSIQQSIRDSIPGSPKDRIIFTLKYLLFGPEPHHHPFIKFYETSITPMDELETGFNTDFKFQEYRFSEDHEQIISLKKLIKEFKKNDIKLIIFSSPYQKTTANENDVKLFEKMLEKYSKQYDFPIYFLHEKYIGMNIWRDGIHVGINKDTLIFTKDILKILLEEMNSNAV